MKYKAVIFDMDGVLVDSEINWHKYESNVWEELGIVQVDEVRAAILGKRLSDVVKIVSGYAPGHDVLFIRQTFDQMADKVYADSSVMDGVAELLEFLREKGVRIGLASSSMQRWIDLFFAGNSFKKYFDVVLSGESLDLPGKPDPAIYLEAAKRLDVSPDECVVIEDSFAGVSSGKASGAYTIAIPDMRWSKGDFSIADMRVSSLHDEKIRELFL